MVASKLNPYLNFRTDARPAMEFYQQVFGGDLTVRTFADFGSSSGPDDADLVMHGQLETSTGFTLMASDVPAHMNWEVQNGTISLSGNDVRELTGYFTRLADGGKILQPLEQAPWGDHFGMLTDRFGITWLTNISGTPQP